VDISKGPQGIDFGAVLQNWVEKGIADFVVETDSKLAESMIKGNMQVGWKVIEHVASIRNLLGNRSITYVSRKQNQVADGISKWARMCKCVGFIYDVRALPKRIRGGILLDRNGYPNLP